jgi:hypothetical protein
LQFLVSELPAALSLEANVRVGMALDPVKLALILLSSKMAPKKSLKSDRSRFCFD